MCLFIGRRGAPVWEEASVGVWSSGICSVRAEHITQA